MSHQPNEHAVNPLTLFCVDTRSHRRSTGQLTGPDRRRTLFCVAWHARVHERTYGVPNFLGACSITDPGCGPSLLQSVTDPAERVRVLQD
jgi:hypothetical protein